jgi:putative hydroxymethylpyrimidine transporter CytX
MVLLRGLFGTKPSYLPTVLNVVQLIGWTTFELVTIGTALHQVAPGIPRSAYVLAAGVVTTLLALRPLGWIRVLRRYVTIAVLLAMLYLFVQLLRHPLPGFTDGSWNGFWIAVDTVIGVSVSWVPLVSDYSRHARSTRSAFTGTLVGYSITQVACYVLGLVVLVTVAAEDPNQIFGAFMAVPLGTLAFGVLAVRELDQSFADTYSTAVSLQNFGPRWDRRVLALGVGAVATVFALALNISDYEDFLTLIGSVFVPLLGVLIVDYFVVSRGHWDLGSDVPARWSTLVPWALGFVAYQLVNPGSVGWWTRAWAHVNSWLHYTPESWMSASLLSFAVAAVATLPGVVLRRRKVQVC